MFRCRENQDIIIFEISSEFSIVDRIVRETREFLTNRGVDFYSEFKIVLRELMNNAVEHGNGKDPEKMISCTVEQFEDDLFAITVRDEGNGFDYEALDFNMPDKTGLLRHRGYPLIDAFAETIRFNHKGNSITALMRIKQETYFEIRELDGRQVIKPNGDITATVADKFRLLLLNQVRKNHHLFIFDLEAVTDMDSVALGVFFILPAELAGRPYELEIINACDDLKNLFRVTFLDREYKVI